MKMGNDFVDATAMIRGGVYLLLWRGEVVFVGKSAGPMLGKLAAMRSSDRPRWLPKINFDQILIRHVHPDQLGEVYYSLVAEHQPRHNAAEIVPQAIIVERRL